MNDSRQTTVRLAAIVLGASLASCGPATTGGDAGGLDGGALDAGDAGSGSTDGSVDARADAGSSDECTRRCMETLTRCGSSEGIDCGRLCATYQSELVAGCESERDAYFACGFGPTCMSCSAQQDALASCIVERSTEPCFAYCRAAIAAGCAPGAHDPEDCNCIAVHYETVDGRCGAELDAYYACAAAAPCDRRVACDAEGTALNTCGLGCAAGQVGCYVGASGRCIDEAALQTDPENCGGCNQRCGAGSCIDGACVCAAGSHVCPDGSCYTDDDIWNCGSTCTLCPSGPANSTTVCSDGACGFVCDAGYRTEGGSCVRDCGLGEHLCGDRCIADDDPTMCGAGCMTCPAAPTNGHAVCMGGACDFACDTSYVRVGEYCLGCDPYTSVGCSRSTDGCYLSGGGLICAPAGTLTVGSDCAAANDCARGLVCVGTGPGTFTCQRVCEAPTTGACPPGETCYELAEAPSRGVCLP